MNERAYPADKVVHDEYIHASERLVKKTRAERTPYILKLCIAWTYTLIVAIVMGFLATVAVENITGVATLGSAILAIVLQCGTIFAFHEWFHCQHAGISDWRLTSAKIAAVIMSLFLIGIATVRIWQALQESEMPGFLAAAISVLLALIDPVMSAIAGAWTAGAAHELSFSSELVKRATK